MVLFLGFFEFISVIFLENFLDICIYIKYVCFFFFEDGESFFIDKEIEEVGFYF